MKTVAIVEDDKKDADVLVGYLKRYEEKKGEKFSVEIFASSVDFLTSYKPKYEIIFLDIELPFISGMEAARKLREKDKEAEIVFVTNMAQYAVNGYEVGAFDFIVKPVSYYNFEMKLDRLVPHINMKTKSQCLYITCGDSKCRLNTDKITYVEVSKHKLIYHTFDGEIVSYGTLKKVEEEINDPLFVRCNNCYLVNLRFVGGIEGIYAGVGDAKLLISAPRRADFEKALTDYICGGGGL